MSEPNSDPSAPPPPAVTSPPPAQQPAGPPVEPDPGAQLRQLVRDYLRTRDRRALFEYLRLRG